MEWHDASCRRLDLAPTGELKCCLSCGSFEESRPQAGDDASSAVGRCYPTTPPSPHHLPINQKSGARILILQPGEFEDPICGDLLVIDLLQEHPYEALSYTWADESGDATPCKTIQLGGRPFLVTTNCENALRRLRRTYTTREVWVDAICIDQSNLDERGHQVQLMPRIYSSAQCVVIYVGEATDDGVEFLLAIYKGGPLLSNPLTRMNNMMNIKTLFEQRYFSRIWVLQEVALARKAVLIYGSSQVSWDEFKLGIGSEIGRLSLQAPVLRFDGRSYNDIRELVNLVNSAAICECEDPRDKVYSLLGLFPHTVGRTITPNYNLSIEEVYAEMALHIASEFSWALLFNLASNQRRGSSSSWPSWVPDWRYPGAKSLAQIDPTKISTKKFTPEENRFLTAQEFDHSRQHRFDRPLMSTSDFSLELQTLRLPDIYDLDFRSKYSFPLRDDEHYYYLPEDGSRRPPGRFLMADCERSLPLCIRWPWPPSLEFWATFTDISPICSDRGQRPLTSTGRNHSTSRVPMVNGKTRIPMDGSGLPCKFRTVSCVAVTEALSFFRQRTGEWGFVLGLRGKGPVTLEELQDILDRLSPVDKEAESLWPVPEWEHLYDLKQRWISRCRDPAPWGSFEPSSCDDFLQRAAELPPVKESFTITEQGSLIDSLDALVEETWDLEQRRFLTWKILLRVFLPTETPIVIY